MKNNGIKNNYFAFTLAEVLITLGVIGVVAAITIPTLINNSQKTQYVVQLQKMTSVLNNGFKQIMADNGCSDIPCTGIIDSSADITVDNIKAANVFNIAKVCHVSQTGCHDNMVYLLSGGSAWVPSDWYSLIVFNDGSVIGVMAPTNPNCDRNDGSNQYATLCTYPTIIDINGSKPPNTFGRDVFRFVLSKNGTILPIGVADETHYGIWSAVGSYGCGQGDGQTCFGRIVEQGWQMNY